MRCAACDKGGLDTGTTQNRSSLGVLLVMRGGFDEDPFMNRSSLGVLLEMRGGGRDMEVRYGRDLDEDTS